MTDEIDDRLSRRFDTDGEEADDDQANRDSQADMSSNTSQTSQTAQNIKKEWNVRSFYLDDELNEELTTAYKRLDFELSEAGAGVDLQKTRHFYPLIVRLGLERLESMDVTEVTEELEGKDDI